MVTVDAKGLHHKQLNERIRQLVSEGVDEIEVQSVNGQRYIGAGHDSAVRLRIYGVPGNDLGVLANGPTIEVFGNGQDGIGNTMNDGRIILHGDAADILGYSMRGGSIFVKGSVGYRVGIHAKAYQEKVPLIVIGGRAGDFFGEYMAGGVLMLLGLGIPDDEVVGDYVGTGMHGGAMYTRVEVAAHKLGAEVAEVPMTDADLERVTRSVEEYCRYFGGDVDEVMSRQFHKYAAVNTRPYGRLYAY